MTSYCQDAHTLTTGFLRYATDVFRYNLKVSEVGITNHLIYHITSHYGGTGQAYEAWALHSQHENTIGADIEIFVERSDGRYFHYLIQAKVMSSNGRYDHINHWSPNSQIERLIISARRKYAHPLYLLYNGNTLHYNQLLPEHGMTLVSADLIKEFRQNQRINQPEGNLPRVTFSSFPENSHIPYFEIYCSDDRTSQPDFHGKQYENVVDFTPPPSDLYKPITERADEETIETNSKEINMDLADRKIISYNPHYILKIPFKEF